MRPRPLDTTHLIHLTTTQSLLLLVRPLFHAAELDLLTLLLVAFVSSLRVAAIQQHSPDPLDYNVELVTVGDLYHACS